MKSPMKKNTNTNRALFLLFFIVALITETIHRYYYRAELDFRLSETEIGLAILIGLIIFNPKGIKLVLLGTLLFLIVLSTRNIVAFHSVSKSLILKYIFSFFQLNAVVLYLIHQIIYGYFIYRLIKNGKKKIENKELLYQSQ